MVAQPQGQQPDTLQKQNGKQKKTFRKLALIITIVVGASAILAVWILSILNVLPAYWANILYAVVTVGSFMILLIVEIVTRNKPASIEASPPIPAVSLPSSVVQSQPSAQDEGTYRDISGFPPPTDARTIQQRAQTVEDIYIQLSQPDITALVLTGIGGAGKSTLAALVYEYDKKQRQLGIGIFQDTSLWLTVNESVTMADLAGTLSEALGKS
ncbi:MAG TPA: NB-ARC domain-containing protein [Ktedonobacteraceae bacterium]|nr:NB-ARC domain-containing protein [Ktedonobacteraceae bacterium]